MSGDPWEECMKQVNRYDRERCKGWKEDIDTLIVFSALFSAVVTPFAVESYKWLSPDPDDEMVHLLHQLSQQLSGANPSAYPRKSFVPSTSAVTINALYFASLMMSLVTVFFGILCKQWLREYQRDASIMTHKEGLQLRQMRSESLTSWGIPAFLASLPIMFEIAVVLFFAALLFKLWMLHPLVASPSTCIVLLTILFVVFTTVMPSYQILVAGANGSKEFKPCAYKSPQAWLFYRLVVFFSRLVTRGQYPHTVFVDWVTIDLHLLRMHGRKHAHTYEMHEFLARGLKWVIKAFGDSMVMMNHIFHCLQDCSVEETAFATSNDPRLPRDLMYFSLLRFHSLDIGVRRFRLELLLRCIGDPFSAHVSYALVSANNFLKKFGALGLNEELLLQLIISMRSSVVQERISHEDVSNLFSILSACWQDLPLSVRVHADGLFTDLEIWLKDSANPKLLEARVNNCVDVLLWIIDDATRYSLVSYKHFIRFVKVLDDYLISMNITPYTMQRRAWFTWEDAKAVVLRLGDLPDDFFTPVVRASTDSPLESVVTISPPASRGPPIEISISRTVDIRQEHEIQDS